ncbi:hypothetical protein BUALT_Bualt14G0081500 [Buddleja alternifolia]|uniref:F-box/LRR-repeat protein 15/At3g58940/PEG3-like LRR domain-containing protein n=1 Tax=Buddleja alternifolia TaxID=168488 RepID=A0AAV6WG15_9LAMI|nr:hypothetical protein BUALT_Bualt14G0081500 [Buddleja alternifolia]
MEEGKRSEAINGEIHLPEPIIQHIQSYINGKEAAQTSVVSKSWYNAWLTAPNLDFDARNFQKRRNGESEVEAAERFQNFVKKTMQRYQELNLKIVKFRLWMTKYVSISVANELITKALKMDVSDLNLDFSPQEWKPILPYEVLEAQRLIRLSAIWCEIRWPEDRKVLCSKLESLSLCKVIVTEDVVWDIISSCPLIENLLLSECTRFRVNRIINVTNYLILRSPFVEFRRENVGSVVDGPINVSEFHKLKSLLLQKVIVDEHFFSDFSLKFPCLEDLSLHYCNGYKGRRQISSQSLKCISLTQTKMLWVKFDVPNICKFTFSGTSFPRVSFTSALKEWESHISILCDGNHLKASWFNELKRFLTKLTPSNVTLSLGFFGELSIDHVGEMKGLPRPELGNLILSRHSKWSISSAFLDGLFWSCRPKVITINGFPRSRVLEKAHNESVELRCKRLIQQLNQSSYIPNQNVFGQRDLQEVNAEYLEEALTEWTGPLPFAGPRSRVTTLFSASTSPQYGQKVRFRLKWAPSDGTGAARVYARFTCALLVDFVILINQRRSEGIDDQQMQWNHTRIEEE